MKIVDTLAEQSLLEDLLERTKPPVPAECRELHYLLSTPFRYGAPYPTGSRFRRAGFTAGVFYGSEYARDCHRRAGVPPPALLCRLAGDAVAAGRGRVHGVLGAIPHR